MSLFKVISTTNYRKLFSLLHIFFLEFMTKPTFDYFPGYCKYDILVL